MANRKPRFARIALGLLLVVPALLSACSGGSADDPNNARTLRIGMIYGSQDSESYYRQAYTDMYEYARQNLEIEFVYAVDSSTRMYDYFLDERPEEPDMLEELKGLLTGDNPVDVVLLDLDTLNPLVQMNLLKPLEPLVEESDFDLAAFAPPVLDAIREQGNGQLYALTPTFSASALFYNKKLFESQSVPAPTSGMTWDDVFTTARRMTSGSGKDAVFGLTLNSWGGMQGYWDLSTYLAPLRLRMFDDQGENMTVNTPQWEKAWSTYYNLYNDHILPHPEDFQQEPSPDGNYRYDPYQDRGFFNGRVAMTVGDYSLINDLVAFNRDAEKMKKQPIDWGVVTLPHHPEAPGIGNMYLSQLFAIGANAANPDDAWDFVQFVNGAETAKFKSRSLYELSTLTEFLKPRDGLDYDPAVFYSLKPMPPRSEAEQRLYRERTNLYLVEQLGQRLFDRLIAGELTVPQVLQEWETKGNELLQKIKDKPRGQIEDPFGDGMTGGGKGAIALPAV